MPKNKGGKFTGQLHCSGVIHTFAFGYFRENGPTKILCSKRVVGKTMCSTGAPSSSRSAMHSLVGATGACTHKPPVFNLITVMRTFTDTFKPNPMPCFCSKNHILPASISYRYVCLANAGTRGKRGGGAMRYPLPFVSSLSPVPLRISVLCIFVVGDCTLVLSNPFILFVKVESTSFISSLILSVLKNAFVGMDRRLFFCSGLLDFTLVDAYALREDRADMNVIILNRLRLFSSRRVL